MCSQEWVSVDSTVQARWTMVDELWPSESADGYAQGAPSSVSDPSGTTAQEILKSACRGLLCSALDATSKALDVAGLLKLAGQEVGEALLDQVKDYVKDCAKRRTKIDIPDTKECIEDSGKANPTNLFAKVIRAICGGKSKPTLSQVCIGLSKDESECIECCERMRGQNSGVIIGVCEQNCYNAGKFQDYAA